VISNKNNEMRFALALLKKQATYQPF